MSRGDALRAFLDTVPFARTLGFCCDIRGDEMTAILPADDKLIGNVGIRAIHGGATGALLELTAMSQVFLVTELERPPRPIDLTIDYLRTGRADETVYARAKIVKLGSRIATVRAEAWQTERAKPIAALRAQFMVSKTDTPA